jgi:GT2 family glycosyltransferase
MTHHVRSAAIVVNWNSAEMLQRCLACLLQQTRGFDRIVVVDNGSAVLPQVPPGVELLAMGENTGFAHANNQAVARLGDCDWIALINPDAYVAADWLERMLAAADRYSGAASFASCLIKQDETVVDGLGDAYHLSGMAWRRGHAMSLAQADIQEREVFSACAAAALYRRESFVAVGGFDERFFCYFEDVDLGFRLRLAGYSCVLVAGAVAIHVGSATSGGARSDFAVYHGQRNMIWCFCMNMPGVLMLLLLPIHLLANIALLAINVLRGSGLPALRGKVDALRKLPAMLCSRRLIQAQRRSSLRSIWQAMNKQILPSRR